jgi:adenylate cyclase class 2
LPTEIEVKMKIEDVRALEARLAKLGADHERSIRETDTYFDTPQSTLRATDQGLRVRTESPIDGSNRFTIMTHKGPRAKTQVKSRRETELVAANTPDAIKFLEALGFRPVLTFEKIRHRWLFTGCHVDLDTLPLLGHFVEIEGPSEEAVLGVRKKLSLDLHPLIGASYIEMLSDRRKQLGISSNELRLEAENTPGV